jgi:hypothetical protein
MYCPFHRVGRNNQPTDKARGGIVWQLVPERLQWLFAPEEELPSLLIAAEELAYAREI